MYQDFKWTKVGQDRNAALKQHEPMQPYIFLELAKEIQSEIFVDVGANIGTYSMFLSSLDLIQKVYSFEASPDTFRELEENVHLNNQRGKIYAFGKAISNREGKVRFGVIGRFSGANGIVSTSIHDAKNFKTEVEVDCVPLDNVVPERSRTICIKIDVEGHEKAVVDGARNFLMDNVGLIQVESYAVDDSSLQDLLRDCGYTHLFSIGADEYYTNRHPPLSAETIVAAFSRASAELMRSNFDTHNAERPGKIRFSSGVVLEISGPMAGFARRLKAKLASK